MKTLSTFWHIKSFVVHFVVNFEIRIIFVTIVYLLFMLWIYKKFFSLWASADLLYLETSAKTGKNVEAAFLETARKIYENLQNGVYALYHSITPTVFFLSFFPPPFNDRFFTVYLKHSRGLRFFFTSIGSRYEMTQVGRFGKRHMPPRQLFSGDQPWGKLLSEWQISFCVCAPFVSTQSGKVTQDDLPFFRLSSFFCLLKSVLELVTFHGDSAWLRGLQKYKVTAKRFLSMHKSVSPYTNRSSDVNLEPVIIRRKSPHVFSSLV